MRFLVARAVPFTSFCRTGNYNDSYREFYVFMHILVIIWKYTDLNSLGFIPTDK